MRNLLIKEENLAYRKNKKNIDENKDIALGMTTNDLNQKKK